MKNRLLSPLRLALASPVAALALFVLWPASIDPVSFKPPSPPALEGPLAPNQALWEAAVLGADEVSGPEGVEVGPGGILYAGTDDGRVVRLKVDILDRTVVETVADTGGRPLGLATDAAGNLLVADGLRGLLRIDSEGKTTTLASGAGEVPFGFTDDLDVASDGKIYFSDASSKFGVEEYLYDLLEARPHGRLLVYDPATEKTRVLLEGLYFANGVALSQNEDFVLVNETYRYRIRRYWLKGIRTGTSDTFLDNLPGFPDGISANGQGRFWVALFTVRNSTIDRLHPHPWAKALLSKLPKSLWPKPQPYGLALAVDEAGRIEFSLHDPTGRRVREVTSVEQAGDALYFGNLSGRGIARLDFPQDDL